MKHASAWIGGLGIAFVACMAALAMGPAGQAAAPGSEVGAALSEPESSAIPAATYPAKRPGSAAAAAVPRSASDLAPDTGRAAATAASIAATVPAAPAAAQPTDTTARSTAESTKAAPKTPAELAAERAARELAARELAKTRMTMAARRPKTEFDNTTVKDALKTLGDVGRFSIVIDPALEEAGVDLSTRTVTFKAAGLTYEDALNLVLPREAGFRVEAGYILVTTQEKAWLPLKVAIFSLKMATADIPDFTSAPRFSIGSVVTGGQGGQGGGGLFGVAPGAAAAVDKPDRATPERIVAMLKQFVRNSGDRRIAPWDDDGGPATIQQLGNQIVVMQTEAGVRAVAKFLAMVE
jgi:hypothetical protein